MTLHRAKVLIACAASGLLIAFSMPPWGWWPLIFVGVAILERLSRAEGRRARMNRGAAVGVAWLVPSTVWMWDLTPPGYIAVVAIYSALLGGALALCPPGRGRLVGFPAMLVLFELARWSWPFGGVPLATFAMSQADAPLGPVVRVAGPLLLVAVVAIIGVGLSAAADRHWQAVAVVVAVIAGVSVITAIAPDGRAVGDLRVAIVQGGGPQGTRAIDTDERVVFERHLAASALIEGPVDLVLWPENVVNVEGRLEESRELDELASLARELDTVLVAGIVEGVDRDSFLNAAVVFDREGTVVDRYDKVRRVPFGEYVPLRSFIEPFAPDFLPRREATPGTGRAVLQTPVGPMGVAISWEVFFDDRAREAAESGGRVLLNPTNGSSYWLTIVQSQQVASSRLRAMETGRWVLQAAPTGFSAIVSPDGEVIERSGVSEQRVIEGTIEVRDGTTLAVRGGRTPMIALALAALAGALALAERDRRGVTPPAAASPARH